MGRHHYIETDGEVYLVRGDDGVLRFPATTAGLPFKVRERFRFEALPGEEVIVGDPELDAHPTDWVYKDSIPERSDVDTVVRKAINSSLPRCVVSLAITRPDPNGGPTQTLAVKAARGMTRGTWNIPGGYLHFNEHPSEGGAREGQEELGCPVTVGDLIGVYSEIFTRPGHCHHLLCFGYHASLDADAIEPDPDEIADVTWMPLAEAVRKTHNPFAKQIWQRILDDEADETDPRTATDGDAA